MPFFFILIATTLLSLAVYFSFYLLNDFLKPNRWGKIIITLGLIVASFGFLFTLSWSRSADNVLVHFIYIFLAVFLGLLFYLTFFGIIYRIVTLLRIKTSFFTKAMFFIILALLFFVIGLGSAYFTKVKDVSVSLNNLPLSWQGKKIAHISDVHLGNIYGPQFLERLIAQVNDLEPDLIVITGDLFDGTDNRFDEFAPLFANFKAKEATIFVTGNHDTYLDADLIEQTLEAAGVVVLRNQALNLSGLEVVGLDYSQLDEYPLIENLDYDFKNSPRILLKHTPTKISLTKDLQIDLQLSGHSHRGQMFPLSFLTRLIYGKYHYGLQSDEGYQIYTSSGVGSWGPPLRAFNQSEIVLIELN